MSEIMHHGRCQFLTKFLHFPNNEISDSRSHSYPKLKIIYEVFQLIYRKFQTIYMHEEDKVVDESLVSYNGKLGSKKYIT